MSRSTARIVEPNGFPASSLRGDAKESLNDNNASDAILVEEATDLRLDGERAVFGVAPCSSEFNFKIRVLDLECVFERIDKSVIVWPVSDDEIVDFAIKVGGHPSDLSTIPMGARYPLVIELPQSPCHTTWN